MGIQPDWYDFLLSYVPACLFPYPPQHPVTGELITEHRRIALRYLRTWFIIDLLATFPSDYVVRGIEVSGAAEHREGRSIA